MYITLTVLLCLIGHVVRDGTPNLGNTQLARALAAMLCMIGAAILFGNGHDWSYVWVGLAVWGGFYTDQKHGEGQSAGWGKQSTQEDIGWLALSGSTSVIPLALVGYFMGMPWAVAVGLVVAAAVLKPCIWLLMWEINNGYWPNLRFPRWFQPVMAPPTRPAAGVFGAYVGGMMGVISYAV